MHTLLQLMLDRTPSMVHKMNNLQILWSDNAGIFNAGTSQNVLHCKWLKSYPLNNNKKYYKF